MRTDIAKNFESQEALKKIIDSEISPSEREVLAKEALEDLDVIKQALGQNTKKLS